MWNILMEGLTGLLVPKYILQHKKDRNEFARLINDQLLGELIDFFY